MTAGELTDAEAAAVTAEALRLNDRFVREVIEHFNICPFARGARTSGRAVREVLLHATPDVAPVRAAVARYEAGSEHIEVVQLIMPRLALTPAAFDEFVAAVRAALGRETPFALAGFHPDFTFHATTPAALVRFFRKAPQPMIQVVRVSVLDAIARDTTTTLTPHELLERYLRGEPPPPPPMSERIARDNHARYLRDGAEAIAAIYASIAREQGR